MSIFRKDNCIIILEKDKDEIIEHFIERGNYIVSRNPKSEKEYNRLVLYSRIYINIKYLGCEYGPEIMKNVMG